MAISQPEVRLGESDKRLLSLMEKLLMEQSSHGSRSNNFGVGQIVLSDAEASELAERLEKLLDSRQFFEASYFIQGLSDNRSRDDLREMYLAARKRNGRSRMMSSQLWADFSARLGGERVSAWGSDVKMMTRKHFFKMERKLLIAAGLQEQTASAVMSLIEAQSDEIDRIRSGQRKLQSGLIREVLHNSLKSVQGPSSLLKANRISSSRISASIVIIADCSVLFSTRDWSVAGTLSTLAGAVSQATKTND